VKKRPVRTRSRLSQGRRKVSDRAAESVVFPEPGAPVTSTNVGRHGISIGCRCSGPREPPERSTRQSTGVEVGAAYHDRSAYSYSSAWDPSVTLTASPATFGDTVNVLAEAGFWIDRVIEPP
jgi:hypothetical protein